jgi:hypothetical protein
MQKVYQRSRGCRRQHFRGKRANNDLDILSNIEFIDREVKLIAISLEDRIKACLLVVENDLKHDLRLGLRRKLWCSFDGIDADSRAACGHKRRIKLSVLTVEKVLPIWESAFPQDLTPHYALTLMDKLMVGAITSSAAEKERDDLESHYDSLDYHEEMKNAVMVGYAAKAALTGALWDGLFGCEDVNEELKDIDVDAYEDDPSLPASLAYCGGPTWDPDSDSQKRLEFWTWWLTSAVRSAALA